MEPKPDARPGVRGGKTGRGPTPPKIANTARETFRMVPDRLWIDRRLGGSDLKVWCALCFLCRGRDFTDATDDAIAHQLGLSPRTVRDSLRRLETAGFLSRDRQGEARRITLRPEGDGRPIPELGLKVFG